MSENQHVGRTKYENKYGFVIEDDAVEKFKWIIKILSDPWKTEFVDDVLAYKNSYDFRALNKVSCVILMIFTMSFQKKPKMKLTINIL